MPTIKEVELKINKSRIGIAHIEYHGLVMMCEICVYKKMKIWIRMPEVWMTPDFKKKFIYWPDKSKSDEFQKKIVSSLEKDHGFSLELALELKKRYDDERKKMTLIKKKTTII